MYARAYRAGKRFTKNRGKQLQSLKLRTEYGKRDGIFSRTKRNFLRFRYEKPTAPQRKTYGSHGGNIRFAEGKHKNNGNVTRFSTRGLQKIFPHRNKITNRKWDKDFFLLLKLHSCNEFYKAVS